MLCKSVKVSILQVVLTSVFALNEPEFDGFYCNSTSICSLDRSPSNSSHPFTPVTYFDRKPHFHVSMLIVMMIMFKKCWPHFW